MSALVKACNVSQSVKNTGFECSSALGATAMIIAVPKTLKWTTSDMDDFPAYIQTQIHAAAASRAYPMFGDYAPIRIITVNDADDVTQTFDDGFEVFIRSGFANRILETNEGGLCYAKALRSFINAGYAFIEIDKEGQSIFKKNSDGTFSGFPAYLGGATPKPASFTEKYMNRLRLSYDPTALLNSGEIYSGLEAILGYMGLIDVVLSSGGSPTTTVLKVKVTTECAESDLTAIVGSPLAVAGNFTITKTSDSSTVTPSAVAIENDYVKFTGTFSSGSVYRVALNAPSVLKTNGVSGYEMQDDGYVDFTIP